MTSLACSERLASLSLAVVACVACGGNVMTRDVGVSDVTDQSTVRVADDHAEGHGCDGTFFTDWSEDTSRAIETASENGLVAVRVDGCKLEVVASCKLDGSYELVDVTPSHDRTEVSDENAIAIGVMGKNDRRVGAEASLGHTRSVDYAILVQRVVKERPKSTSGDCARATHYASAISLGAYELTSSQHAEVTAIVKVHAHDDAHRHGEGDVERCTHKDASIDDGCRSPLKLELSRLPK